MPCPCNGAPATDAINDETIAWFATVSPRAAGGERHRGRADDPARSASPRIRTCSIPRSRAPSSAASSSPSLCDKLFDIDEKLNIVPQLATAYEWAADHKALTIKLRQGVDLPRRREVRRRGGQVQHRAAQDHAGLEPPRRAGAGRRASTSSTDTPCGSTSPRRFSPLLARARRPRRHDGLAEGGAGRGRQVRRHAGLLRARSSSSSASRRTASCSSASRTTGTRARSTSTRSSTSRSSIPRCGSPT